MTDQQQLMVILASANMPFTVDRGVIDVQTEEGERVRFRFFRAQGLEDVECHGFLVDITVMRTP
jgi:hypothetical protein